MLPRYKISASGEVGESVVLYDDKTVLLRFKDGRKQVLPLDIIERTDDPTTNPMFNRSTTGGRHGVADHTVDKMLEIFRYIEQQTKPPTSGDIERALDLGARGAVSCLMIQESKPHRKTLEGMGIARRIPQKKCHIRWELTFRGKTGGERMIEQLRGAQG